MAATGREHVEMAIEAIEALEPEVRAQPQYRGALDCLRAALGHLRARERIVAANAAGPLDVVAGPEVL